MVKPESDPRFICHQKQISSSYFEATRRDTRLMLFMPSYLSLPCLQHGTVTCSQ